MNYLLGDISFPAIYLWSLVTHQWSRFFRKSQHEMDPGILELAYLAQFAAPGFDPRRAFKARREKINSRRKARAWRIVWSLATMIVCLDFFVQEIVLIVVLPELIFVLLPEVIVFGGLAIFTARKLFEGLCRWR